MGRSSGRMPGNYAVNRRDFLKMAAAGTGAVLLGAPALSACGDDEGSTDSTDAIKIVGSWHLTGIGSVWGRIMKQAAELAVYEINDAGGVLGRPLQLISIDDQTDGDVAAREVTKAVQDKGAVALWGTVYSTVRAALDANVIQRYHTPFFGCVYNTGEHCGPYLLNFGALSNQQLERFVPFLMEDVGDKFYFLGASYVWPQESIAYLTQLVESLGGTVVGSEFVGIGTTSDWAPIIGRIRDAQPDVFFPFIGGDDLISMLTQFASFGLNEQIQVAATLLDESFIPALPESLREGILASESYFTAVETDANRAWLERYRLMHGQNALITNVSEMIYVSMWMWREAIEACGRVGQTDEDYDAMVHALEDVTFDNAPQGPGLSMLPGTNHMR